MPIGDPQIGERWWTLINDERVEACIKKVFKFTYHKEGECVVQFTTTLGGTFTRSGHGFLCEWILVDKRPQPDPDMVKPGEIWQRKGEDETKRCLIVKQP